MRDDPEKEMWCINQIQRIVTADHVKESLDNPYSISEIGWETFLAEILINQLTENASDADTRSQLAQSVFAFHYTTTKILCKSAYRMRDKLGIEFGRILNLCGLWAGIRWAFNRCEQFKLKNDGVQEWFEGVKKSFIDCTLSDQPIPLLEIALRSEDIIRNAKNNLGAEQCIRPNGPELYSRIPGDLLEENISRNQPGLDWDVIQAAYGWLTSLDQASNREERERWIGIHRELFDLEMTYINANRVDEKEELDGTPFEFERWIFSCIARLIPQLGKEENPMRFWQPILDMGAQAYYWVEEFLSIWFIEGTKSASSPRVFVSRWGEMIQYTLKSPAWRNNRSVLGYYRLDNLQIELMGLHFGADIIGQKEYFDELTGILQLFEQWAKEWLTIASVIRAFATFIMKPSASNMMFKGLMWLADGIEQIKYYTREEDDLSSNLVSLLFKFWKAYSSEIESNPEIKNAFYSILNLLIAKNYAPALELRDQLIQAKNY